MTALQVTDLLPAGLTFVSATATQGSYTAVSGIWDVGALAIGSSATLQLVATVNGTSPVTNTASRSSSTPVDPNLANDSASAVVTGSLVPGLPNNGVAPLAAAWPILLIGLLLALGFAGLRRRKQRRRA